MDKWHKEHRDELLEYYRNYNYNNNRLSKEYKETIDNSLKEKEELDSKCRMYLEML